jgi:validoxylamine A glucosyltransferase
MKASVIIPTRNRAALLQKTLLSLSTQSVKSEDFEVIVADHDSDDGTDFVCGWAKTLFDVRRLHVPASVFNVQKPKNAGIKAALGKVAIVIDCGMILPPKFIEAHMAVHDYRDDVYASGPTYGWESEQVDDFWKGIDPQCCPSRDNVSASLADCRSRMKESIRYTPWMLFWGCNFSARIKHLNAVGLFDESLEGWGWDDLELGFRLHQRGLHFVFCDATWCLHFPHPRRPSIERSRDARTNWIRAYDKHHCPLLELWEAVDYWDYEAGVERLLAVHEMLRPGMWRVTRTLVSAAEEDGHSAVYIGFAPNPALPKRVVDFFSKAADQEAVHSFGLRTPFSASAFDRAIISRQLIELNFRLSMSRPTVLQLIMKEARRIAGSVFMYDASDCPPRLRSVTDMIEDAGVALLDHADRTVETIEQGFPLPQNRGI